MTVKELKRLCIKLEDEGYEDSDIRVLVNGRYCIRDISLTPDEYGDITISTGA